MKASEKLKALYAEKAKNGLVDVRFDFTKSVATASVEEICEDILKWEEAIAAGHVRTLNFGDASFPDTLNIKPYDPLDEHLDLAINNSKVLAELKEIAIKYIRS